MDDITKLILDNEGLIYKCANKFRNEDIDDLYQAGCIGIIKASKNYNPSFNTKFSSYAYSYILGEMKNLIYENKPLKISRDIYNLQSKINEAFNKLSQILMYKPSNEQISAFLEIPVEQIELVLNYSQTPKYLDEEYNEMSLYEKISSDNVDLNDLINLKNSILSLEEPERSIMIDKYFKDMTQSEIANHLGLTQVSVSRKQSKALCKIRN